MNFGGLAGRIGKLVADNSALVLTAMGAAGTLATAYLAAKASFEAAEVIQQETDQRVQEAGGHVIDAVPLTNREKTRLVWEFYIPAASTAALTVSCIILVNRIGTRRAAAMATAYAISDKAFEEYRAKVKEKFGHRKEESVRTDVMQDRVKKDPPTKDRIIMTGNGEVLCRDEFSERYFRSTVHDIKKAVNDINFKIINENYASLGDFYEMIGLKPTSYSEELGWTTERLLELSEGTTLTEDDQPCFTFNFSAAPIRNYYRIY